MAEILVSPEKIIYIDDEDFERASKYCWRVNDAVAGHVARRNERGRPVGLSVLLLGKRPTKGHRFRFLDGNSCNFSKANICWTNDCERCGRRVDLFGAFCAPCRHAVDAELSREMHVQRHALRAKFRFSLSEEQYAG